MCKATQEINILFSYIFFSIQRTIYIKGYIFVCVGVEYLAFDILLHAKSEKKLLVIKFVHQ